MRGDKYMTSETSTSSKEPLRSCCYYTVSTYCLTEDHVSPLLEEETLGYAAGGLLQKHKCHGFLSPLHHLHHTLLQPGHQRTQLLPPVACEERWDGDRRGDKGQTEMEWQSWCGCGQINTPMFPWQLELQEARKSNTDLKVWQVAQFSYFLNMK